MKPLFNSYPIFSTTKGKASFGVELWERITYKFLLIRSENKNPWGMDTSLTKMNLSASQAINPQWDVHFRECKLEALQELFRQKSNAVSKEEVLAIVPQFKLITTTDKSTQLNRYILGETNPSSIYHPCSVELHEVTELSLSISEGGLEWGGAGATVQFDEVTGPRFKGEFEKYGATQLLNLFKKKGVNVSKQDLLNLAQ